MRSEGGTPSPAPQQLAVGFEITVPRAISGVRTGSPKTSPCKRNLRTYTVTTQSLAHIRQRGAPSTSCVLSENRTLREHEPVHPYGGRRFGAAVKGALHPDGLIPSPT